MYSVHVRVVKALDVHNKLDMAGHVCVHDYLLIFQTVQFKLILNLDMCPK